MKTIYTILLLLAIELAGCAYVTASQEFNPYVDKPVALAISQYGPPASKETTSGNTYYSWEIERRHPEAFPGFHSVCRVTMMVNANGVVTAYTIRKTGGAESLDSCR